VRTSILRIGARQIAQSVSLSSEFQSCLRLDLRQSFDVVPKHDQWADLHRQRTDRLRSYLGALGQWLGNDPNRWLIWARIRLCSGISRNAAKNQHMPQSLERAKFVSMDFSPSLSLKR
jgi:hypothetical protein